jgi:hypothetical protein
MFQRYACALNEIVLRRTLIPRPAPTPLSEPHAAKNEHVKHEEAGEREDGD